MELVLETERGTSVEECIREAVKGLTPKARLDAALQVIGDALDLEERSQEVIVGVWRLLLREKWWEAQYDSLQAFMTQCGFAESIFGVVGARIATEKRKRKFEKVATEAWGGGELRTLLGPDLMPLYPSKVFLQSIQMLARKVRRWEDARELLTTTRDRRLAVRGASKDTRLRPIDVEAALRESEARSTRRASKMIRTTKEESMGRLASMEEGKPGNETRVEKDWGCRCQDKEVANAAVLVVQSMKGKELRDKMSELEEFDRKTWDKMCYDHIRSIASGLELKTTRLNRTKMVEQLDSLQKNADKIDRLLQERETRERFRMTGRPRHEDDSLGPFKFHTIGRAEFVLDDAMIWSRFGGAGSRERFAKDGNVVISGVFDWIFEDPELMGMVETEFEMYRHHLREQNGNPNLGWCRNMWHSLVQQVVRQDQVFYALNVVARPDKNWRLVSIPYYVRYALPEDSTEFKHVDINLSEFLDSGRGGNMVQTAISVDDEWEGGCTVIVPGFHEHVAEWWNEVVMRGGHKNGRVHSVEHIYKDVDEERFGKFVPVVCGRGDIRMTLPQILHGSTGCSRRRRVIFPWLTGMGEDHRTLEIEELGSWEDISRSNRDMEAIKTGPSGQGHRFSVGPGRFACSVEIRGVSALGDALLGARRWDSGTVLRERDTILGPDPWEYIERVRSRMKVAWREAFRVMVELEMASYGETSYFRSLDGLAHLATCGSN